MKLPILILLAAASLAAAPEGRPARPEGKPGAERPGRPDLAELRKKLEAMSPEERKEFLEKNPELREKLAKLREGDRPEGPSPELRKKLADMSPEERKEFLEKHPELKERLAGAKDKIDNLTPSRRRSSRAGRRRRSQISRLSRRKSSRRA